MNPMGQLLELLYDVLFHPGAAMNAIAGRRLMGQGLLVLFISVVLPSGAIWVSLKGAVGTAAGAVILLHVVGSVALWLIATALMHLIAECYGGRGMATGLLAALGFAQIPRIFFVPLWVASALLPEPVRLPLMGLSAIGILMWILALHISALKGTYGFPTAKAVLVFVTPLLAAVLLVLAVITFVGVQLAPLPHWG